jgi:hypothetical protein
MAKIVTVSKIPKTKPATVILNPAPIPMTRTELMLEAKARGIKQFRVMNKAELSEIVHLLQTDLGEAGNNRIQAIQKTAVARWKSGWKK